MTLDELRNIAQEERERHKQFKHRIHVCVAAGCLSSRSDQVKIGLEAELHERGLEKICQVKGVGCMGLCAAGPLVMVDDQIMYQNVQPVIDGPDCSDLIDSLDSRPVERLALSTDLSFFKDQKKRKLRKLAAEQGDDGVGYRQPARAGRAGARLCRRTILGRRSGTNGGIVERGRLKRGQRRWTGPGA
jgi:(2Fe-2S) ferredoxin